MLAQGVEYLVPMQDASHEGLPKLPLPAQSMSLVRLRTLLAILLSNRGERHLLQRFSWFSSKNRPRSVLSNHVEALPI